MPRRNSSFSIAVFTAADVASTAGVVSHVSRVIPSPASWASSRSRSPRTCPVRRWPTLSDVSAPAPVRAVATISISVTTPGRVTCALTRNSAAWWNSRDGVSCSIARSCRNCSRSFSGSPPVGTGFQSRYLRTRFR